MAPQLMAGPAQQVSGVSLPVNHSSLLLARKVVQHQYSLVPIFTDVG